MAVPVSITIQNQIANLYIAILGRNPDPAGFGFWCETLANNNGTAAALDAITIGFSNSPEFIGTYAGRPTAEAVGLMYTNVLDRTADAGGLAFWTAAANAYIAQGYTIAQAYALTGNDIITAASTNTGSVDQTLIIAKEAAAVASGTAAPTTTYTLTTGVDTATANVFTGIVDGTANAATTFTTLDALTGKATNATENTLRLIDAGQSAALTTALITPLAATLTNIGNLQIVAADAIGILSTAGSLFSGVSNVTVTNAGAITALTAGAAQALTVTNTAAGNGTTLAIDGGTSQTISVTGVALTDGQTGAAVTLGGTTAPTGAVSLTVANSTTAVADTDVAAGGVLTVNGGSTVTINQTIAATGTIATGDVVTLTQGATDVNGTASTTAVTVNQTAAQTAAEITATTDSPTIVAGAVAIDDVNAASLTAAGTIATVTLNNAGAATINSGALTTLNLAGTLTTVNAGTLGALTTAANTALAVNLTGAVSTGALTVDTDITTINITGSGTANTLADLVDASATAVNVAGTVGVTVTTATLAAAAVITSTNTAGTTWTEALEVGQQFVGGEGADTISIGATTKAINMGAGNDVVTISSVTLGTGGTLNGGLGTNTIVANTNGSEISGNSNITNFTTLRVSGAAAEGTHNATGFTALQTGTLAGNTTFSNVAAGTGLTIRSTQGGNRNITYTLANATGTTDVLGLTLSSAAQIDLGTGVVTAAGVETINITNTDTNTTAQQNIMTLTAAQATTITVTGNAGLNLTATGSTAVTRFDASGITGAAADAAALAVVYASLNATTTAAVTITGGSGNDTLSGNAAIDTITGGAGNDTIQGGTGADIIDGGTGTNTFVAVASGTANVEGAGTGTTAGMAINLGSTAVTAAAINAAMTTAGTSTVGLSGASTSLAAGTSQYIFATQSNLFATTTDTLANIQNVTGSAGRDYIVGSNGVANGITAAGGADQIIITETTAAIDTIVQANTASIVATAKSGLTDAAFAAAQTLTFGNSLDVITGFAAGTGGDVLDLTTATAAVTAIGVDADTLVAGTNYFLSGNFVAATGVFTITAAGAGADTLIIQGYAVAGVDWTTNASPVLLVGVDSDNLVAANYA